MASRDQEDAKRHQSMDTDLPYPTPESSTPSILYYAMDNKRRGKAIIINNKTFARATGKGARKDSDVDAASLYTIFKSRGFDVKLHNDLTVARMKDIFKELCAENHRDADCFVLAILSHAEDDYIYGTDGPIWLEECILPFKSVCESLAGKPKIFIVQTSLGGIIQSDAHDPSSADKPREQMIPQQADVVMVCSSEHETLKSGDEKGIRFVQAFKQAMCKSKSDQDFINILTETNNKIAQDLRGKKAKVELPCIISTLTQKLIFHDK